MVPGGDEQHVVNPEHRLEVQAQARSVVVQQQALEALVLVGVWRRGGEKRTKEGGKMGREERIGEKEGGR